jgi:hypothetical protein
VKPSKWKRLFPYYEFRRQYRGNQKYKILREVVLNQIKIKKIKIKKKLFNKITPFILKDSSKLDFFYLKEIK